MKNSQPPINPKLLELIHAKQEFHWQPTSAEKKQGFRGWHQRGYLPHFDAPGVTQFVTFQLEDAFPVQRIGEWELMLRESKESAMRRKIEAALDRGHGQCWLKKPTIADTVKRALLSEHKQHYGLRSWVIMSNHVHLVVEIWDVPLSTSINRWKGTSSRAANRLLQRTGKFWARDYFDTLIRDDAHCRRAIRYVEQNPVKAYLVKDASAWPWSSAAPERDLQVASM